MKEILKNKHKHTLVFEDDFVFNVNGDEFNTEMNKFLDDQKEDWDIVQLAMSVKTDESDKDYKKVQLLQHHLPNLINKDFVPKLLENLQESLALMEEDMKKFNQIQIMVNLKRNSTHRMHWIKIGIQKKITLVFI